MAWLLLAVLFLGAFAHASTSGIQFEPNLGQAPSGRFIARGSGYTLQLHPDQLVVNLGGGPVRIIFAGANPAAEGHGLDPLASISHDLRGNDPAAWRTHIPHFGRVRFAAVYPGIDVVYYSGKAGLEFDFLVDPGADPARIRFRFEGGDGVRLRQEGHLSLGTASHKIHQLRPGVYQERDGQRVKVAGDYVMLESGEVRFELGAYDRAAPLVIDPALQWFTYLGGTGSDQAFAVATDAAGNMYLGGATSSTNFPVPGALQRAFAGGAVDAFLSKISPNGRDLIFSTYLGGSMSDRVVGVTVDESGHVLLTGGTSSPNLPVTPGSLKTTIGGAVDGFLMRLDPTGSKLVYSTYIGGPGDDLSQKVRRDAAGNIYLAGQTSGSFPTTEGAYQRTHGGGLDAWVMKLDRLGRRMLYSTLIGGAGTDFPYDLEVTRGGEALITGTTGSNIPATPNAFQPVRGGGVDAFIAMLNALGSELRYFTYLGGSNSDEGRGLTLDHKNNVWVAGGTGSTNFPATANAPNRVFMGGDSDGFIARLPLPLPANGADPPGEPSDGPLVGYVGDGLRNFGLDVLNTPLGIVFSLSNFAPNGAMCGTTPVRDTFGVVLGVDQNAGTTARLACLPGADATELAADNNGGVVAGGVGLPNGVPGGNVVQPNFGGGDLDAYGVKIDDGAFLRMTKTLDPKTDVFSSGIFSTGEPAEAITQGTTSRHRIDIVNSGREVATGVVIRDLARDRQNVRITGFEAYQLFSLIRCQVTNGDLICDPVNLRPGERTYFHVEIEFTGVGEARNRATAQGTNTNLAEATTFERVRPRVGLIKKVIPDRDPTGRAGDPVRFEITVSNPNTEDLSVGILDVAERGVIIESASWPLGPCEVTAPPKSGFECARQTLRAGASAIAIAEARLSPVEEEGGRRSVWRNRAFATADRRVAAGRDYVTGVIEGAQAPPTEPVTCAVVPSGRPRDLPETAANAGLGEVLVQCQTNGISPAATAKVVVTSAVPITNPVDSSGNYAGISLSYKGADGQLKSVAGRPDTGPVTIRFDGVEIAIKPIFVGSIGQIRIDARDIPDNPLGPQTLNVDLEVTANGAPFAGSSTLDLNKIAKVQAGLYASPSGGGVRVTVPLIEGFANAFQPGDRFNIEFGNLPPGAEFGAMPECIPSLGDPEVTLRRVLSADSQGAGGVAASTCGVFIPTVLQRPQSFAIFTTWALTGQPAGDGLMVFPVEFDVISPNPFPPGIQFRAGAGPYLDPFLGNIKTRLPEEFRSTEFVQFGDSGSIVPSPGGLINAASGGRSSHGLSSLFGTFPGVSLAQSQRQPLATVLDNTRVYVLPNESPQPGARLQRAALGREPRAASAALAPLLFVSATQINFQIPWEVDLKSGFVDVIVMRNGVASPPVTLAVAEYSPGIFTFDSGAGRAVAINPDGSVAHPANSFSGAIASRPVKIGEALVLLATGMGPTNPPAVTGDNSLDSRGNFVRRDTVLPARVTIGGVAQNVVFSGMSPQFAGVNQVNVIVTPATPAGNAQEIVIEIGGVRSRAGVTVAVSN